MDYIIEIIPPILDGFKIVLIVYTFTLFIAMPLGLLVAFLIKDKPLLKRIVGIFTWIVRGTPLLLQLYIMMYGIPLLIPMRMNRLFAGTLTFIINYTAYFIEIFRSGLAIIPLGQIQAGEVLGLSKFQIAYHVLLPQVFRNTLLPLINEAITLVKDTSLLAAIAIGEMLRNAREIVARDLRVEPLLVAGAVYLLFSLLVVQIGKQIEGKVLKQR
jgi:polar amino acid transport system permease protein